MEKKLITNRYLNVSFFTGVALGIAFTGGDVLLLVGPLAIEIKAWVPRKRKK